MKITVTLLVILLCLNGCDQLQRSAKSYENNDQIIWAYLEIQSDGEASDYRYYLFGEMKENLFDDISNNAIETGYFMLSSVKYYDDNNLVAEYADDLYTGNLVFRIEDIQMIKKMKKAPAIGLAPEVATEALNTES